MNNTFGALKRAERETGVSSGVPPVTYMSENTPSTFSELQKDQRPEVLPLTVKPDGLNFPLKPVRPIPPEFKKSADFAMSVEEYQKMKYRILNCDANKPIKTILFCSSNKGEGNSTVLVQFAQTLAAEGYRVLLVDADVRNPNLHRLLRMERENGLTELSFGDNKKVADVMKETSLPNLWVVTNGAPYSNPLTIFESEFFDLLIDQMKIQTDWVLFDSPPLNSSSASIALAGKVDGIVLVIQAEKTRWEVVQESKERLEKGGGRILGVVLNKRRFHIPGWVYGKL